MASSARADSSESGESSKGSSSHTGSSRTTDTMVDGFALFALAIQENLRAKLKKKERAEISDQALFGELRKLWREMGEEQKLEWQSQANSMPSSLSGSHDSSSLNGDEDDSSQDSSGASAGERSKSTVPFAFRKSESRLAARSEADTQRGQEGAGKRPAEDSAVGGNGTIPSVVAMLEKIGHPAAAAGAVAELQQPELGRHLPCALQQSAAMRGPMADTPDAGTHRNAANPSLTTGIEWAQAARQAALANMSLEERMQLGAEEAAGSAQAGLSFGFTGGLAASGARTAMLENILQLQRQQEAAYAMQAADVQRMLGLQGADAAQWLAMHQRLQGAQGLQNFNVFLALQAQTQLLTQMQNNQQASQLRDAASRQLPSIVGPRPGLPCSNLFLPHQGTPPQPFGVSGHRDGILTPGALPGLGQTPPQNLTMLMPRTVADAQRSPSMSTLQDAAQAVGMPRGAVPSHTCIGSSSTWGLGGVDMEALQRQQHEQQQQLQAGAKRSFDKLEKSGLQPQAEPPQVRTMTFVCDLFSPHDGHISLQILADTCNIVSAGYGIVGLSCQLSSSDGMRVVKRGQVKDARRHFAHQAQLRLSLASSPNLSVKVFSTGRLQIAGCHDESSCMEAVKIVAQALNEILEKNPLIMKRQVKSGLKDAGATVDGQIDLEQLPTPKIVMINCSFDSGMAALGYSLDPYKLTQVLNSLQGKCNSIEEVSYHPDQRYTGVKVKFKPSMSKKDDKGDAAQPALCAGDSCKSAQRAQEGDASEKREIFIGMFPSGKAVITGAVRWEEVQQSYDFARSVLCDYFDYIKVAVAGGASGGRRKTKRL